jgi:hypothetical protein
MARKLIPINAKREDCVQTPIECAEMLVKHFNPKGRILEPCKGDGNFLSVLPKETLWCEILKGKDFFDFKGKVDWIITNPPYSKVRKFMQKAMEVSDNIVFLTAINHLWLKARLKDIFERGFGVKEIVIFDTPKNFPQSSFQIGAFYLKRGYVRDIKFNNLEVQTPASIPGLKAIGYAA